MRTLPKQMNNTVQLPTQLIENEKSSQATVWVRLNFPFCAMSFFVILDIFHRESSVFTFSCEWKDKNHWIPDRGRG